MARKKFTKIPLAYGSILYLDAADQNEIWIKGKGSKIFGTIKIKITEGPKGFGLQIKKSVGDVPLTVDLGDKNIFDTDYLFVYELDPDAYEALLVRRGGK